MAPTLQQILGGETVVEQWHRYPTRCHWLENVDGDPHRVRTACGRFKWCSTFADTLLDPNRAAVNLVTCPGCLAAMSDVSTVVAFEKA